MWKGRIALSCECGLPPPGVKRVSILKKDGTPRRKHAERESSNVGGIEKDQIKEENQEKMSFVFRQIVSANLMCFCFCFFRIS